MQVLTVVVANMCSAFKEFFPAARDRWDDQEDIKLAEMWLEVGQRE
jgi:hypothetical protein